MIDAREILRRMVLTSASSNFSNSIADVLKAVVPEAKISWARVSGNRLAVYCYTERDGDWLKREFGGTVVPTDNQREDYYVWHWEAPYR